MRGSDNSGARNYRLSHFPLSLTSQRVERPWESERPFLGGARKGGGAGGNIIAVFCSLLFKHTLPFFIVLPITHWGSFCLVLALVVFRKGYYRSLLSQCSNAKVLIFEKFLVRRQFRFDFTEQYYFSHEFGVLPL